AEDTSPATRKLCLRAVAEHVGGPRCNHALLLENVEVGVPGDLAQRKYGSRPQHCEFPLQIAAAVQHLLPQRLVVWRCASAGSGDVRASQLQAVIALHRCRLIREAGLVQCGIQEIARAVTGEDAAGSISTMRRRSQPQDEQLCLRIAKARHWLAPIR